MNNTHFEIDRRKSCCFTGHRGIDYRDIPLIRRRLQDTILHMISQGVIIFFAGGALGFDTIASQVVLNLREKYPQIKLILILPCREQASRWRRVDLELYNEICIRCDKIIYISEFYTPTCMFSRNRALVDNSSFCICYLNSNRGGTAFTVNYANSCGLFVENVFLDDKK